MKIGIIGPGALGTFLAGMLGRKNEVILFGRRRSGIKDVEIIGETELVSEVDFTTDVTVLSRAELVVICTKSYDTEKAVKKISDHLSSGCKVLSLQNGLENEEIIARYLGEKRTIGGITTHGITHLEPGKVKHAGTGETVIGGYPRRDVEDEYLKKVVEVFRKGGITTELSDNIIGHIWKKVIVNVGINPITALMGVKNGFLLKDDNLIKLMEETVEEASKVAEEYTELPVEAPVEETKKVAEMTQENRSSMLQDVENKRKTEIGQLNGAVVEKGEEKDIPVKINRTLYRLIKSLEDTQL